MKKRNFCIISVLLFTAGSVFAQVTELRLGAFTTGNIRTGGELRYSFRAAERGFLAVETTGNIDLVMKAYDENMNLLAEDDDSGENYNPRVEIFADTGKLYIFVLTVYGNEAGGQFRIIPSLRPLPPITALRTGVQTPGNLISGDELWYSARSDRAGIFSIETISSIDTILTRYDNNYVYIDENDDGGNEYNARLEFYCKAGETYIFRLRGYDTNDAGRFQIIANIKPFPTPTPLNFNIFTNGNISPGEDYWFSVRAARRGRLYVGTVGDTDTYLYAYTDTYDLITENDDSEDLNAAVTIPVEANRTYLFRLRGYAFDTSGAYRIMARME